MKLNLVYILRAYLLLIQHRVISFRYLISYSILQYTEDKGLLITSASGGSRHLVWGGPRGAEGAEWERGAGTVSYTHLTLPTIYSV